MLVHLPDIVSALYLSKPVDTNQIAGNGRDELSSPREGIN